MTKAHVMQMNSGYLNDGREILRYASVATASDTYSRVAPGSRRPLLTRLSRCRWNLEVGRIVAGETGNEHEAPGTRTRNRLIKSQLLYQLS
jgi:hypothetical protein